MIAANLLYAQGPTYIGGKLSPGFVLAHHPDIRYTINKPVVEQNIFVGFQTTGKRDWQQHWGFPEVGFAFHHTNIGDSDILGHSFAAYLYFDAPFYRRNILSLNYFVGFGTTYLSKPFDPKTNYLNITNGSHINVFLNFNGELQIRTQRVIYFTDFGLTHYSNGGTKFPNLGLNLIAGSVGFKYKLHDYSHLKKASIGMWKKHSDLQISYTAFVHANNLSVSYPPKFITSLSTDYGVYISPKSRFGVGFNIMYDSNGESHFIQDSIYNSKPMDYISGGIHLSCHAVLGNAQVIVQQIFFVRKKYDSSNWMYQKVALNFMVTDNLVMGIGLLANFFNAITLEPTIGYRFH